MKEISTRLVLGSAVASTLGLVAPVMASGDADSPSIFTGDLGNVFWQLLIFGLLLIILGKTAWKPILGGLQKREDFIRDSLQQAKADREQAEATLKQYTDQLEAARAEATTIVEEGRRDADTMKVKIEDNAKAEAKATLDRAKREIGLATDAAVKELYALSANLATGVASRIISKELSAADHERLISESIAELHSASGNGRSTH